MSMYSAAYAVAKNSSDEFRIHELKNLLSNPSPDTGSKSPDFGPRSGIVRMTAVPFKPTARLQTFRTHARRARIGASAGGLEAFKQLLHALPVDTGMGFVLVQHLAPTHASNLAEILSRSTRMTVMEVQDESRVRPNHVFVIPPDRNMIISGGTLQLVPRESSGLHRSIDYFFRSLGIRATKQSVWFYPPDAAR
jgi:chemotaxis response regulator CheB